MVFLVLGLVAFSWFPANGFIWGDDASFGINQQVYLADYFHLVSGKIALSTPDASKFPFLLPFGLLLLALQKIGLVLSVAAVQKCLLYTIIVGAGLSTYYLFRQCFPEKAKAGAVVSGLLYSTNVYAVVALSALSWILFFFAFFPLILGLFINRLHSTKPIIMSAVTITLAWSLLLTPSYVTPPFMLITWGVLFIYLAIFLIIGTKSRQRRYRALLLTGLTGVFWLVVNLFWLLPQLLFVGGELSRRAVSDITTEALLKFNSTRPLEYFKLLGPDFLGDKVGGQPYHLWFSTYAATATSIIGVSVFATVCWLMLRRRLTPNIIFFFVLLLVFGQLTLGDYSPMKSINNYFYSLPAIGEVFRSIWQRFMPLTLLSVGVLFGYVVSLIPSSTLPKYAKTGGVLVIVIIYLFTYSSPFWKDQVFPARNDVIPSRKVKVPDSYTQLAAWLNEQPDHFFVLPLPIINTSLASLRWQSGSDGYWGTYPLMLMTDKRFITGQSSDSSGKPFTSLNMEQLKRSNVRYVLLHKDINWPLTQLSDVYFSASEASVTSLDKELRKGYKLVKEFGDISVYEVPGWQQNYLQITGAESDSVTFREVAPGRLSGEFIATEQPLSITLNEPVSENYRLFIRPGNCADSFGNSNCFYNPTSISSSLRLRSLNSSVEGKQESAWLISQPSLKPGEQYSFMITFYPQILTAISQIISFGFLFVLMVIWWIGYNRRSRYASTNT